MESPLWTWTSTVASIVTASVAILFGRLLSNASFRAWWTLKVGIHPPEKPKVGISARKKQNNKKVKDVDEDELQSIKQLYYQLHALEDFSEALSSAKKLLVSLLQETSTSAKLLPEHESILSVKSFSREKLKKFQQQRNEEIGKQWEEYNFRRNQGMPRELFEDKEEAVWWLKQISPVKYVDGAWLGHVGKVTMPFGLGKTIKGAWQILSEELGDGDLSKNHVALYHELLERLAPGFPTPETIEYGLAENGLNDVSIWKAGIAQLIISLFPHEFLPEILGYNLHFEGISMDTLRAVKELKEVGIDPYYFILHVSIDNSHSGHTAIAIEVVCEYMDHILRTEGEKAGQKAWEKVQAGYLLSAGLPGSAISPSRSKPIDDTCIHLTPIETEVMGIFKAKAQAANGIHCASRRPIGSRLVDEWLDPVQIESESWQKDLLNALGRSKYWIQPGDSSKSRFIQEMQWNGRMFGTFTQDEYEILRKWVDNLSPFAGNSVDIGDVLSGSPVFHPVPNTGLTPAVFQFEYLPPLRIGRQPKVEVFFPLWFSHPSLLHGFITVPIRTKNEFACTIVKILRAQGGFDIEQECVGGLNEFQRPHSLGLPGIGTTMLSRHGVEMQSLKEVLQLWPSSFAVDMLHLSMRPLKCRGMLIGMATAFAKMHEDLANSHFPLMTAENQDTLRGIAARELEGLAMCWKELEVDEELLVECRKGYLKAAEEIEKCFDV